MTDCPLCERCGRRILSPTLHDPASGADCNSRSVVASSGMVPLTESCWHAFEVMHAGSGRFVRPTQIAPNVDSVRTIIFHLRKALAGTGFCIEPTNRRGIGYRLIVRESLK